ncbi:hypothetical protein Avbf_08641 [Armadillidium vulgare]|nr:hypothetical protein Avbf_08641 [Armadillidium vulgare]
MKKPYGLHRSASLDVMTGSVSNYYLLNLKIFYLPMDLNKTYKSKILKMKSFERFISRELSRTLKKLNTNDVWYIS